jgi:hypothetical protein
MEPVAQWAAARRHGPPAVLSSLAFGGRRVWISRVLVSRGAFCTVFLAIERPAKVRVGQTFALSVFQRDSETQRILGGSTYRVEIVLAAKR